MMKTPEQRIEKFVRKLAERGVVVSNISEGNPFPNVLIFELAGQTSRKFICMDISKFTDYKTKELIKFVGDQYLLFDKVA